MSDSKAPIDLTEVLEEPGLYDIQNVAIAWLWLGRMFDGKTGGATVSRYTQLTRDIAKSVASNYDLYREDRDKLRALSNAMAALVFVDYVLPEAILRGAGPDDVGKTIRTVLEYVSNPLAIPPTIFALIEPISYVVSAGRANDAAPPKLEGLKPITHYEPNAITTNYLTHPDIFDYVLEAPAGHRKGQLVIDFGLSVADAAQLAEITTTKNLDREDVSVIGATVTLKNAGNTTISPFQIAEAMGYHMPTAELQEEIHERVMKLRCIDGRIDWTVQAKHYGINDPETGKPFERAEITGHLIDCNVFEGTDVDGHRYIRYQMLSDPITYQHAHQLGQVVDYPQRLLEVKPIDIDGKRKRRVTRDQTKIARAVLKYVHIVKNPKSKASDSIGYDTLFEHAGVDVAHPKRRQRAVVFVNDYLRALQAEGVIKGFQVVTRGASHKPTSVRVVVAKRGRR